MATGLTAEVYCGKPEFIFITYRNHCRKTKKGESLLTRLSLIVFQFD